MEECAFVFGDVADQDEENGFSVNNGWADFKNNIHDMAEAVRQADFPAAGFGCGRCGGGVEKRRVFLEGVFRAEVEECLKDQKRGFELKEFFGGQIGVGDAQRGGIAKQGGDTQAGKKVAVLLFGFFQGMSHMLTFEHAAKTLRSSSQKRGFSLGKSRAFIREALFSVSQKHFPPFSFQDQDGGFDHPGGWMESGGFIDLFIQFNADVGNVRALHGVPEEEGQFVEDLGKFGVWLFAQAGESVQPVQFFNAVLQFAGSLDDAVFEFAIEQLAFFFRVDAAEYGFRFPDQHGQGGAVLFLHGVLPAASEDQQGDYSAG